MPRHNTVKALPPVASGLFKTVGNPAAELRPGDLIYVPAYVDFSVSTLRSAGLSVGETNRSTNRAGVVSKVFGHGHEPLYLLVDGLDRTDPDRPQMYRWSSNANGQVLNVRAGDGNDIEQAAPAEPEIRPITMLVMTAIPAKRLLNEDGTVKPLGAALSESPARTASMLRSRMESVLKAKLKAAGGVMDYFNLRNTADGEWNGGVPMTDSRDPGGWLLHAMCDYAADHNGGVGGGDRWIPPYEQEDNRTYRPEERITEPVRDSWLQTGRDYDRDQLKYYRTGRDSYYHGFVGFLESHGCYFLRPSAGDVKDVFDMQAAKETAAGMVERIARDAATFREFLELAVPAALAKLDRLADKWANVRDGIDSGYGELAEALAAVDPDTRYGVTRRR